MTDDHRLRVLEYLGFDSIRIIPSVGRSGGLAVAWNSNRVTLSILEENRQFFHLQCKFPLSPEFFLTAIYAVPHSNLRAVLWDNLLRISNNTSSPWSVVGDFNDIQSVEERIGGRSVSLSRIRWFQDRINEAGLSDLGSVGPTMTWRGPRMDGDRGCTNAWIVLWAILNS
ncbi:hypothetical protein K1719_029615 [Acacia pycnantha]|nr:hypothetical protein K1719_029615 [Acacia pycnantha]